MDDDARMSAATVIVESMLNSPHPFLSEISANPGDVAADAVVHLLTEGGVEQISMSAVARYEGVTPSALHHQHGGRAQFLEAVVRRFSLRWVDWATRCGFWSVVPVRLPENDRELLGVRAWPMIRCLAEGERRAGRPECSTRVGWALAQERRHVAEHFTARLGHPPSDPQVESVLALGDWLRQRLADPEQPLDLGEAQERLRAHITQALGLPLEAWDRHLIDERPASTV